MNHTVEQITNYIKKTKTTVNQLYKPIIHFSSPIGWINDPNGFSFDGSYYHLYYQYHPFSSKNELMYWGHAKSSDLIHWEHLPIALVPNQPYDKSGIFSGSVLIEEGVFYTYYTGHVVEDTIVTQTQCLAISKDGIEYKKYEHNPILDATTLPNNTVIEDFRDPKIVRYDDTYVLIVGSRTQDYQGQILFYTSTDRYHFTYQNRLVLDRMYGDIVECPDMIRMDQSDVLIFSTQNAILSDSVQNKFSVFAFVGSFDVESCTYSKQTEQVLDYGFDFYAPQVVFDGISITLIAWLNSWDRSQIPDELNHGWNGSMTFPRRLTLQDHELKQSFVETLYHNSIRKQDLDRLELFSNTNYSYKVDHTYVCAFDLDLSLNLKFELKTLASNRYYFSLIFDGEQNTVTVNRQHAKHIIESNLNEPVDRVLHVEKLLHVELLVDRNSVEVLINGISMSSQFYGEDSTKTLLLLTNQTVELRNFMLLSMNINNMNLKISG